MRYESGTILQSSPTPNVFGKWWICQADNFSPDDNRVFQRQKIPFYSKDREWLEDAVGFLLRGKFWDTRREVCIMYQTGNTPRFWKNKAWKWRKKGTKNYAFYSGAALEMGKQKKNLLHSIWQKYTNDTYWQKQSEKKRTFFYGMVARTNSSDVGSTKIIKLYVPHCSSMLNEPFLEKREEADWD